MKKTITLSIPPRFNYYKTIRLIQRGVGDPTNHIYEEFFTHCYQKDGHGALIKIIPRKISNTLEIVLLQGHATPQNMQATVSHILGLDDPLLHRCLNKISAPPKLLPYWGITIPGYLGYFEALVQIILGQQISVVVANHAREKFVKTFGIVIKDKGINFYTFPSTKKIAAQSLQSLHALGISEMKSKSILTLARKFTHENFSDELNITSDRDIVRQRLQEVYGIGHWTVDWFLLRALRQFDVIPKTDIAVRKALTWWVNSQTCYRAMKLINIQSIYILMEVH